VLDEPAVEVDEETGWLEIEAMAPLNDMLEPLLTVSWTF
jgi:hypothetical protein